MRWMGLTKTVAVIVLSFSGVYVQADGSGSHDGSGEAIYNAYCGACHGFEDSAPLANTPNLAAGERLDQPDSTLLDAIRTGKGSMMPAWAGILDDEQCQTVLRFIRASSNAVQSSVSGSE